MATKTLITVEEFARMASSDSVDYELVEGELVPLPGANPNHAKVRQNVERAVAAYFDQNPIGVVLGEVDCRILGETVRRPDLSIILASRFGTFDHDRIPLPFSPDIAVEVISPSETLVEVRRKTLEYLAGGTRQVWQFDQENGEVFVETQTGIQIFRGHQAVLNSPLLPGFSASLSKLLAGLDAFPATYQ